MRKRATRGMRRVPTISDMADAGTGAAAAYRGMIEPGRIQFDGFADDEERQRAIGGGGKPGFFRCLKSGEPNRGIRGVKRRGDWDFWAERLCGRNRDSLNQAGGPVAAGAAGFGNERGGGKTRRYNMPLMSMLSGQSAAPWRGGISECEDSEADPLFQRLKATHVQHAVPPRSRLDKLRGGYNRRRAIRRVLSFFL